MGADRTVQTCLKQSCPVCHQLFYHLWQHLTLQKHDPEHAAFQDELRSRILDAFKGDLTAVEVGSHVHVQDETVLTIWRETHGSEALRRRSGRLRSKTKPPCAWCGGSLGPHARKFCCPACANASSGSQTGTREKRSKSQLGIPKTRDHASKISSALMRLRDEGTLPAMQPAIRAKQSETKKKDGHRYVKAAFNAFMEKTTPDQRRAIGFQQLQIGTQTKYGVSHAYEIPGVRQRANEAKSRAMAKRISEGIPTNDWGRYKRGWYESPIAGRQWFQSGWERLRMEALDKAGLRWTKNHKIRIPYQDPQGRTRYYVPDFLVESVRLEEVKGYEGANLPCKITAAESFCRSRGWTFVLLRSEKAILTAGLDPILNG